MIRAPFFGVSGDRAAEDQQRARVADALARERLTTAFVLAG
jgi:hypothetical protein